MTRTSAVGSAIASSRTWRIALRASNPIHASASVGFGWVGTKSSPSSASSGSSVEIGPADSYRSTNACDDTKPRVNATLSRPG